MISINSVVIFLLVAVLVDRASAQAPDYIAAHESNGAYITDPYDYFAKPPETATAKCALINVVMDESGSMDNEQAFMRDTAFPGMTKALYSEKYGYDYVFLCTHGFGRRFAVDYTLYRYLGCSMFNPKSEAHELISPHIDDWYAVGKREDGYSAIHKSIKNVTAVIEGINMTETCKFMDKNMILITDEVSSYTLILPLRMFDFTN